MITKTRATKQPRPRVFGFKPTNVEILVARAFDGKLLRRIQTRNLFVLSGRQHTRDNLLYPTSGSSFIPRYVAIGSDGTATIDADTALHVEVFRSPITRRLPLTSGFIIELYVDPSEANGTGTQDLREIALHSDEAANESDTAWARATYNLIVKSISISITYRWTFTLIAS